MRKYIYSLMLLFVANVSFAQSSISNEFKIKADIKNITATKAYIITDNNKGAKDTLASANIKKGSFELVGSIKEPILAFLVFGETKEPIFLEKKPIKVTGDFKKSKDIIVEGSLSHTEFKEFDKHQKSIVDKAQPKIEEYKKAQQAKDQDKMRALAKELNVVQAESEAYALSFSEKHLSSYFTPYILISIVSETNIAKCKSIYDKLAVDVKNTEVGIATKSKIDAVSKESLGGVAPMFKGVSPNGDTIELAKVLAENKYVIIDFWASWCGPCRQENPNVVAAYAKYKSKGLEILGVSLDQSSDKWKAAIEKDVLTWLHISDLKGWKSDYARLYRVNSIPATFILDSKGNVVAKNLRGAQLEAKLAELMP